MCFFFFFCFSFHSGENIKFCKQNVNAIVFFVQLLDMVERNELNRSLLALLDENIANAQMGNQVSLPFDLFYELQCQHQQYLVGNKFLPKYFEVDYERIEHIIGKDLS